MNNKRSLIGLCKLCLERKELERSHLLPEGVYLRLRNPKGPVNAPIIVTSKITMSTSKQVRDYLLCRECEKRFDQTGEDYVLRQMNDRGRFRLLERLQVSPPADFSLNTGIYYGASIGLEMEKFYYFALSVLWRSAVHRWRSVVAGHTIHSANLGAYQEPIRKYLLGESPSPPADVTVLVTVATGAKSQNSAFEPTPVLRNPNTGFAILVCGIHFWILLGATSPPALRDACCFSSPNQFIFSRDIDNPTQDAYSALAATTRKVGIVKKKSK